MASSGGSLVAAAKHLGAAIRRNAGVRQPLSVMRTRSGGGGWFLHLPPEKPPQGPVGDEHELWWGGEHVCDERPDNPIGPYEALGLLSAGMGFFALVGVLAWYRAETVKRPYPLKEYPWLEEWDRITPPELRTDLVPTKPPNI